MKFTPKEKNFLTLITKYQYLLAKQYCQFKNFKESNKISENIILIREQELKLIHELSDKEAMHLLIKVLNYSEISYERNAEIEILRMSPFCSLDRLATQLLQKINEDLLLGQLDVNMHHNTANYMLHNYYGSIQIPDYFLNYWIRLDQAQLFLGKLEEEKEKLSAITYYQIKNGFLYLYPELLDEIYLKNQLITSQNSQILANRLKSFCNWWEEEADILRSEILFYPITDSINYLASYTDDIWDQSQEQVHIAKLYIQNFLEPMEADTIEILCDDINSYYDSNQIDPFHEKNQQAYQYLNDTITEIQFKKAYYK